MHRGSPKPSRDESRSDEALVEAINAGDDRAFEVLYARYRDWVFSLALRFTPHREEALDVMQDAFLYLLRKFPGFELRAKMTTFLYPVVRHLAIDRRRKAKRLVIGEEATRVAEQSPGDPGDDPAVSWLQATGDKLRDELAGVLSELSEAHREVVLLRFVDDMSLQEIAEATETPLGTVKSRLHHALGALRRSPAAKKYFEP